MFRTLALAVLFALAAPAAAQDLEPDAATARATRALSFMWRPLPALRAEAITAACQGAEEEIEAVEAALPPVLTAQSLARVRALHGLLIIPTDDPAAPFLFPDASLSWLASGVGGVAVANEAEGLLAIQDADARVVAVQLGTAGDMPILRFRDPSGALLNFVGCAATLPTP
jgi:hypothetical protein